MKLIYASVWCRFLTGVLFFLFCGELSAQQNIGFENGTFAGWQGTTGQCCPVFTPQQGINTLQHSITTGNATDTVTNNIIPIVSPGSVYSAKLGNTSGSAESERLIFSFTVPADSLLLAIRYAVVFENANHPEPKQPRFGYSVTSSSSSFSGCTSEQIISGDTNYNFITNNLYEFLSWQTRVINLTGQQGELITIVFETGDCEPGGHFGYAYVDCGLISSEITGNFCNQDGSITLYAPPGIDHEWHDGSTTDSITISNPDLSNNYSLLINPGSGCEIILDYNLNLHMPIANFNFLSNCDLSLNFENLSISPPGSQYLWDFGDSTASSNSDPIHTFLQSGLFPVELTVIQPNNCRNTYTQEVNAGLGPLADFKLENICTDEYVKPENLTSPCTQTQCSYSWIINNNNVYSGQEPQMIFTESGINEVMLIVTDNSGCADTVQKAINISEYPFCDDLDPAIYIPNAFTPNGDGINDLFLAHTFPDLKEIKLNIFNRYGEFLYSGFVWDGTYRRLDCPQGLYSYVLTGDQKKSVLRKGTFMLIR